MAVDELHLVALWGSGIRPQYAQLSLLRRRLGGDVPWFGCSATLDQKTLDIAREHFTAHEGTVTLEDIRNAKEAFITSTSKRVIPVVQVDDFVIGNGKPGEVSRFLDEKLAEISKT